MPEPWVKQLPALFRLAAGLGTGIRFIVDKARGALGVRFDDDSLLLVFARRLALAGRVFRGSQAEMLGRKLSAERGWKEAAEFGWPFRPPVRPEDPFSAPRPDLVATRAARLRACGVLGLSTRAEAEALRSGLFAPPLISGAKALDFSETEGPFVLLMADTLAEQPEDLAHQIHALERLIAKSPDLRVLIHRSSDDSLHVRQAGQVRLLLSQLLDELEAGAEVVAPYREDGPAP